MIVAVDGRSLASGRGVGQYLGGMLAALAGAGVELRVVLPRGTPLARELAALPAITAVRHPAPSRLLHGSAALTGRPRLERLAGAADVVWLPAPAPVAVGRATPFALTIHDLSFLERPGDFTRYERLWHRLARPRRLARRAARVLTDTAATGRVAADRLGVAPARLAVVPAGPGDAGPQLDPAAAAAARARLGVPPRYFLFVGALEPRKGVEHLIAAHAGLDAALVLAGEGRLAPRLGDPGVHLLGRVTRADKAALYAGAIAVVLPSWCEGYGYPPLEGYAHGIPAIVSDLAALRETAAGGALYVPAGDSAALAAAMRALAGDDERRRALAQAGAAALRERTWTAAGAALRAQLEAIA